MGFDKMKQNKKRKHQRKEHELEDRSSFDKLSDKPTITLPSGEIISEREWKQRFDNEWYYAERYGSFEIMQTEEQRSEAERNNNNNKRDAYSKAERYGTLHELTNNEKEFMQDASDAWEWQDVFKNSGYEDAAHVIYQQAVRDIKAGAIELEITLTRFFIKMTKLKTLKRRERSK